jgi:predicted amidohydrolase YtcJ
MLLVDAGKNAFDLKVFGKLPHLMHPTVTSADEAALVINWLLAQAKAGVWVNGWWWQWMKWQN